MFTWLFARPNPRLAALEAARKLHVAQINGYAGDTAAAVMAAERLVWQRILGAFQIDPARGLQANMTRICDLLETCRSLDDRFDYSGLIVPTLIHQSGFTPDEARALDAHLATGAAQGKPPRRSAAPGEQAARPVPAFAA